MGKCRGPSLSQDHIKVFRSSGQEGIRLHPPTIWHALQRHVRNLLEFRRSSSILATTFASRQLPLCQYNIIYEGLATKLTPKAIGTTTIIYTLTTQETIFALTKTTEFNFCGYQLTQTEHPKLFILETEGGCTFRTRSKISTSTYFHM